jgi:ubiquinone/menaquinone biosynthesis C-methylase UbiE
MLNETGTKHRQAGRDGGRMTPQPIRIFLPPITSGRQLVIGTTQDRDRAPVPPTPLNHNAPGHSLWSAFWQEFALENEPQERCYVPGDGRIAVDQHWTDFADSLPGGAHVLDLGCGAGVVGSTLLNRRKDLRVAGVDWANVPMMNVENLTIHPQVSMEALPFSDARFDAAVSLFGIEYGSIDKTARELERVLKTGACFSFLVHHRESEILREGCARRKALNELTTGKMKTAFLAGNLTGVNQQRQSLKAQFPNEPMVALVSDHFVRNISCTRAERQATWQKLASDLDPEIALLGHLERAAKSVAEMAAWLTSLLTGMRVVSVSVLNRSSGEPIAWHVYGMR